MYSGYGSMFFLNKQMIGEDRGDGLFLGKVLMVVLVRKGLL